VNTMRNLLTLALIVIAVPLWAQKTVVTAQIKDSNGSLYANCTANITFLKNPSQVFPYQYHNDSFTQSYQGIKCDANGNFQITLLDTVNGIKPNDGSWTFFVSSGQGYTNGPYTFQVSIPISGASEDISSLLNPSAPILPGIGGGTLPPGVAAGSALVSNGPGWEAFIKRNR